MIIAGSGKYILYTLAARITSYRHRWHPAQCVFPVLWALLLLLGSAACSAGISSTPARPPSPVQATNQSLPTASPAGTVLYQADLSHGLADLPGAQGWKVTQGGIESDSSTPALFTIPYRPTTSNYAFEMRLKVERLSQAQGGYFIIFTSKAAQKDGYRAGIINLMAPGSRPNGSHPQADIYIDPHESGSVQGAIDYEPGTQWHTFRIEIRGNQANFLSDGALLGNATGGQATDLSNGPIEFHSELVVLQVSSIRILAL